MHAFGGQVGWLWISLTVDRDLSRSRLLAIALRVSAFRSRANVRSQRNPAVCLSFHDAAAESTLRSLQA